MKILGLTTAALLIAGTSQAGLISVGGGDLQFSENAGQTGTMQIIVDADFTHKNGGLGLSLALSNPGVIEITGATVLTPEFFGGFAKRWISGTVANQTANGIDELLGLSVGTAGLDATIPGNPIAGSQFLFAEVDYVVVGEGTTNVGLGLISSRPGVFISSEGDDVTGAYGFQGIGVEVVPEPGSVALIGLGGLALLRRRR